MKNSIPVDPAPAAWSQSKEVFTDGELRGTLIWIGPEAETSADSTPTDRVLHVSHGSLTVAVNETHFMLKPEETLRLPAGKTCLLRNQASTPAKAFLLTLPRPKIVRELVMPS